MKNCIVDDKEKFVGEIILVALAFAEHKVPYRPEKLDYNSHNVIAKDYYKFCKSLDSETLEKYKANLEERFNKKVPSEAIPIPSDGEESRVLTVDRIKALDAFNMYIAKINNRQFKMTEDGNLIFDEIVERDDADNKIEFKGTEEYYLD